MQARLAVVILAVEDVARSRRFYLDAFGWSTEVDEPVYVEFRLPDGACLGIYDRNGFGRNTGQVPTVAAPGELTPAEVYLRVEDLDEAIVRLETAGARLLSPRAPRNWGDQAAYFADPDGHVLVVATPL